MPTLTARPVRLRLVDGDLTAHVHWDRTRRLLSLQYPDGETEVVNLDLTSYGYVPEPGEIFLKDWSEHAGLTGALVDAGVVSWTRRFDIGPFNSRAYGVIVLDPPEVTR